MVCGEWNQKVHALPPQGADEPLAQGVGLRSPYRRLEHPQPQVTDVVIQREYRKNKATFHASPPASISPALARVPLKFPSAAPPRQRPPVSRPCPPWSSPQPPLHASSW